MAVFAILSEKPEPALMQALETHYPGKFFQWSDRVVALVTADEPKTIAENLGVQRRSPTGDIVAGVKGVIVTKLAPAYYGWSGKNFWEWLKAAHQEEGA